MDKLANGHLHKAPHKKPCALEGQGQKSAPIEHKGGKAVCKIRHGHRKQAPCQKAEQRKAAKCQSRHGEAKGTVVIGVQQKLQRHRKYHAEQAIEKADHQSPPKAAPRTLRCKGHSAVQQRQRTPVARLHKGGRLIGTQQDLYSTQHLPQAAKHHPRQKGAEEHGELQIRIDLHQRSNLPRMPFFTVDLS